MKEHKLKRLVGGVMLGLLVGAWAADPEFAPGDLVDSPRGDVRVGHRETPEAKQVWLVSRDGQRKRLLYEYDRQVDVKFSGNEEWLVITDAAASDETKALLFKRQKDALEYRQVADLGAEAWKFFDQVNELKAPNTFHHRYVSAVSWVGGVLLLSLDGRGEGGSQTSGWMAIYDPETQAFTQDLAGLNKEHTDLRPE